VTIPDGTRTRRVRNTRGTLYQYKGGKGFGAPKIVWGSQLVRMKEGTPMQASARIQFHAPVLLAFWPRDQIRHHSFGFGNSCLATKDVTDGTISMPN
jgi:hypothetical protein